MCIQGIIIALQHSVISCAFVGTIKLLDATNAVYAHVLANLNSIGTPWSHHLAARSDKGLFDVGRHETTGTAEEPRQPIDLAVRQRTRGINCVNLRGTFLEINKHNGVAWGI